MTMKPEDIATVTPELEAACKKLIEGVQMGGPYLPPATSAFACSSPAIMAASTGAALRSIRSLATCSSTPTSSASSPD